MDAEFWIYIVIGAIYFLSRLFKKQEQPTGESPEPQRPERRIPGQSGPPPTDAPRPMTFEELLREITEGKQAQKRPPQPVPQPEYESYEKDIVDEARSLEETNFEETERATKWKAYEGIPASNIERRSLEETLRLEDTVVNFRKFDVFENKDQNRLSDDYIRILRNPQTLKQAVVMSEILKRKF
jgi:hypothetical protein